MGASDRQLAAFALDGDWCLVTRNARDFRGSGGAKGGSGAYAGVTLHAGLVCLHGPAEGFAKAGQLEAFEVALDQVAVLGGDATNLLVEVVWSADAITFEVAEFPPGA